MQYIEYGRQQLGVCNPYRVSNYVLDKSDTLFCKTIFLVSYANTFIACQCMSFISNNASSFFAWTV